MKNLSQFCALFILLTFIIFTENTWAKKGSEASLVTSGSATLVLSQVYGGGGGASSTYLNDYVEIKNVSSTPQSLSGLSLMYGSATGQFGSSAGNIFALPNVTLQPGQYYLVQLGSAGTGGTALPVTPDATTTNLSMSASSGKVALVTSTFVGNTCGATATPCTLPNAAIIDLVAYGAASNAEGGTPTNNGVAITSTQGSVRKTGGCTDTDNNNSDFDIVSAPVPHNSASTAAPCVATVVHKQHVLDFNADGKTDYVVARDTAGQRTWYVLYNGAANFDGYQWGIDSDQNVPGDYDGDNKTDPAVWRAGPPEGSYFYILQSTDNTVRVENFGQFGDDPSVVRDYDGDGKADVAVYRQGANPGDQSYFFYRGTLNNPSGGITFIPWGIRGDVPTNGDFDGDGKGDFAVRRDASGAGVFYIYKANGTFDYAAFGYSTDAIVPGDFDGDGKSDLAVARVVGSNGNFYWRESSTGNVVGPIVGGLPDSDQLAIGDYDGDGKSDIGLWRSTDGTFWILPTATFTWNYLHFGSPGDRAVGEWDVTGGN